MTQLQDHARARYATAGSANFSIMLAVLAVVVILSKIGASKGVVIGPIIGDFSIITDGGFFLFPLAYIIGDVISEVYGFKAARLGIIVTFVLSVFASLAYAVIIALPGFDDDFGLAKQEALELALGPVPLIVLASLLGFVVGQTLNSLVLVRMKSRFGERSMVARLIASTGVGEFADTLIFCAIAASVIGITDFPTFLNYLFFGFVYKTLVEVLLLPVTTAAIRWVKRREPSYAAA